ncbi:MAG: cysteine synthase A [Candidatus Poribacteria bacterium]|nr:cysteine synthase A [Candidatus Poribacteria bacterium]
MEHKLAGSVLELIGKTPLVRLHHIPPKDGAEVLAKLEAANPGGSVKDRIGLSMIIEAERLKKIKPGATIVEPTAGNTGVGLAIVARAKGYKAILTMPENVSVEKRTLLKAYGAEIVLTPEADGMAGAIWEAEEILSREKNAYMPNQFSNPANPTIHRETTGREIAAATQGHVDALVTGVGTGGTLTGVAQALKEHNPKLHVVAVEPAVTPVLSGGRPGPTRIDGLGAGFIPEVLDVSLIDEVITVGEQEAYDMMVRIGQDEGFVVGMSSGANVVAAIKVAKRLGKGKRVVTFLCDTGERYFSLAQYFGK